MNRFLSPMKQSVGFVRKLWLILFFLSFSLVGKAQCPMEPQLYFSSQNEIDLFKINYPNCTEFNGTISITSGHNITNLNGLSNLTSIYGFLEIHNNPQLTNLDGLSNLTSIDGDLAIHENPQLVDITGLSNVNASSITNYFGVGLYIVDNPQLSACSIANFCTYLQGSGWRTISGNAANCSSDTTVIANCVPPCTIPTNVSTTNITSDSATVNWASGSVFEIEYGINGFTRGTGTTIFGLTGTSKVLTSLELGITYQYYIRQNCSSTQSDWAGPYSFTTKSQCPSGDQVFTTQAQIDQFIIEYPNCTELPGGLDLYGNTITNVNGLSNLTSIGNYLEISVTSLTNLDGLSNLTSIGGDLAIHRNSLLTDITGIQNVNSNTITTNYYGVGLYIVDNPQLSACSIANLCTYLQGSGPRTISGNGTNCGSASTVIANCVFPCTLPTNVSTSNITSVSATVNWSSGSAFDIEYGTNGFTRGTGTTLSGLTGTSTNLTSLNSGTTYQYYIRQNCSSAQSDWVGPYTFTTLSQCPSGNLSFTTQAQMDQFKIIYPNCTQFNGSIYIEGYLTNLDGLSNLTSINGYLGIFYSSLTNLNELSNLTSIGEDLIITGNQVLTDITGLQNVDPNSINNGYGYGLFIVNNSQLSACSIANFCTYLQGSGVRTISGNSGDCANEAAVVEACDPCEDIEFILDETASFCNDGSVTLTPEFETTTEGFTGDYASEGWSMSSSNSNGSITFNSDGTLTMISSNGNGNGSGYHEISKPLTQPVTIAFNWTYSTEDGAQYDYPLIIINGSENYFQGYSRIGASTQTGTHSVQLNIGDIVGLRIYSLDNHSGRATVNISNFTVTPVNSTVIEGYLWTASEGGVINGEADTQNLVVNTAGTYTVTVTDDLGCTTSKSVVVTQTITAAPEGETQQYTLADQTLADLDVTGENLTWYADAALTIEIPNTTATVVGTTYYVTQTSNGCESPALAITMISCEEIEFTLDETASFWCEGSVTLTPEFETTIVGFTGDYASEGWSMTSSNSNGSITFNSEGTLTMISSNNAMGGSGINQITKTINQPVTISFNWAYSTGDGAQYDYPLIIINGSENYFQGYSTFGASTQTGTQSVQLNAGDVVGLRIRSTDNTGGAATVNITNFTVTPSNSVIVDSFLWTASNGGVINGAADTQNLVVNTAGTYTLTIINDLGCSTSRSVVVTQNIVEPPVGPATQYYLADQTLADLDVTGENLKWYLAPNSTEDVPSSTIYDVGTYYVTQTINGCESARLAITIESFAGECDSFTIWNGTQWSNGEPNLDAKAIIDGDLVLYADLSACMVEITENGSLNVPADILLTVFGEIINYATSDDFIVANNGAIIQIDEYASNSGLTKVYKDSSPMHRLDYTLWSSPVWGQYIQTFSPNTLPNRIYTYNGGNGFQAVENVNSEFMLSKGYLFRSPNDWHLTTNANNGNPVPYSGVFEGNLITGHIETQVHPNSFTSLGNPYPSNLFLGDDITYTGNDAFLNANPNIGTVFFWTNTYGTDDQGNYLGNNWATYTFMGGTAAGSVQDGINQSSIPSGVVSVGQGFVVSHTSGNNIVKYYNRMRTAENAEFFRANQSEKSRFWLNLRNSTNVVYNQILIGYMDGATMGVDDRIDGLLFGYEGSALYSLIDGEDYSIQGRALPFQASDIVPLGFRADESKKFTIELTNFEGLFASTDVTIFIHDKQLNIVHNLMESPYTFEAVAGTDNDRFEVIYQSEGEMGVSDLTGNAVQIYTQNKNIIIDAKNEKIVSVDLFDLQGRNLYTQSKVNATKHEISAALYNAQVVVVKVETAKGEISTKKIIIK